MYPQGTPGDKYTACTEVPSPRHRWDWREEEEKRDLWLGDLKRPGR